MSSEDFQSTEATGSKLDEKEDVIRGRKRALSPSPEASPMVVEGQESSSESDSKKKKVNEIEVEIEEKDEASATQVPPPNTPKVKFVLSVEQEMKASRELPYRESYAFIEKERRQQRGKKRPWQKDSPSSDEGSLALDELNDSVEQMEMEDTEDAEGLQVNEFDALVESSNDACLKEFEGCWEKLVFSQSSL